MFYAEATDWASENPAAWLSLSIDRRFIDLFMISSSFMSTNFISSLKLPRLDSFRCLLAASAPAALGSPAASDLEYWLYCQQTCMKNISRAKRHTRAQMRKRPQKLPRSSLVAPTLLSSSLAQLGCENHWSWMLWSLPLSESWRMAVETSAARGESLWNACNENKNNGAVINYTFPWQCQTWIYASLRCNGRNAQMKARNKANDDEHVQSPILPLWIAVPLFWSCSSVTGRYQYMASHQRLQQHRHILVHG